MPGKYDIKPVGTISLESQDAADLPGVTSGTAQLSFDGDTLVIRISSGQVTETAALSKVEYVDYVSDIDDFDDKFSGAWDADVIGGSADFGFDPNNLLLGTGLLVVEIHSEVDPPLRAMASRRNTRFYPSQYPQIEYRFGFPNSPELDWRLGLQAGGFESGVALQSEGGVVSLVLKDGGTEIDSKPVTLPALGDEVAYRMDLRLTPSSAQLWMCADRGTLTLVAEVEGSLSENALIPFVEAYSEESISDWFSIVVDYVRWRARRIVPTPIPE